MIRRSILTLIVALLASGCGQIQVHTAYDNTIAFKNYKTFAMMLPNKAVQVPGNVDPFKMLRVRQMAYGQLIASGFKAVEKTKADFVVAVNAMTETKAEVYGSSGPYRSSFGTGVDYYTEGTLVVEFINLKDKTVTWRGEAKSRITKSTTDEKAAEVLAAIFAQFPPPAVAAP